MTDLQKDTSFETYEKNTNTDNSSGGQIDETVYTDDGYQHFTLTKLSNTSSLTQLSVWTKTTDKPFELVLELRHKDFSSLLKIGRKFIGITN